LERVQRKEKHEMRTGIALGPIQNPKKQNKNMKTKQVHGTRYIQICWKRVNTGWKNS